MTIFIEKLSSRTVEFEVRHLFEIYGEVDSVKIIRDEVTSISKRFGFVEMPDDDEAEAAIEELNGAELDGETIVVKRAISRESGGGGDGGGGDRGGGGFRRQR